MAYLLALDQGTTSSRAIVFDLSGRIVALAQEPFEQHFPHPGWVEHDPTEIWHTQLATARAALEQAGLTAGDLAAVGITNQRETVVLWERSSGRPVSRAIVWQDRRTAELTDRMKREGLEARVRAKTGLVLDPYFSASKLAWLLEDPGLRRRAEAGELAFGTIDSWLVWNLTGGAVHATDVSNASRTLLFDIHAGRWDDELLELFRVPRAVLPEVRPSVGDFGVADPQWLGGPVPIHGVLGDQQAALFGQACFEAGMAKNTYGTGAFLVMNTGTEPLQGDGVLTTVAWRVRDEPLRYALEGSIFVAGAAVQWLRDGLGLIKESHEIEALAASVASSEGVYFVPALTGLGSPYWDPHARGLLVGLTRGSGRAHIARATLEAIALQVYDAVHAMETAGVHLAALRADGGAAANDLLLQIQADLLGRTVERPRVTETTALGAAMAAAVGADLADLPTLARAWQPDRRFEPAGDPEARARLIAGWHEAVARARGWAEGAGA
ncbi:glycerol kinase [Oceanithermus profundus DSM 14977]|uniref:Glycerol kinase n=1 Tax=Oceanithermus profundus (strain DSM 14977 / NBRC 100410 / VKM B-2274 / 506) TaxID=670487 RepID=E4U9U2_OCEP5|nr:glycerol kinase GlpK [Oceanithermus profundus]ADR37256.1 glycerol kinase [Oceanithermus profundus DSM 14977]